VRSYHLCLRWGRWKPRGAQIVILDTPDGPLHLANWHLGLRDRERHWQVGKLLSHPPFLQESTLPTMIVGDFNDWNSRLAAAALAKSGFEEATRPASRFRTFPAFLAVLAVDKAFYRGGVRVEDVRIVRTPMAKRASDHLPLVIDFRQGEEVRRGCKIHRGQIEHACQHRPPEQQASLGSADQHRVSQPGQDQCGK
jgi:endonuclease/exonuclease/phosphatase family metal-dependent hydrolase